MVGSNRKDPHTLSPAPRPVGRQVSNTNNMNKHNNNNISSTTTSSNSNCNNTSNHNNKLSPEYLEALQILNETTMNEACELLLQEDDDATVSANKILDVYFKCKAANAVFQKHHPQNKHAAVTLPPGAPILSGIGIAGSISMPPPRSSKKLSTLMHNNKQGGVNKGIPMRGRKQPPSRRDRSDSLPDGRMDPLSSKKARLNPNDPPSSSEAPPPSALNFLAKLNKGVGGTNATEMKRKQQSSRQTYRKTSA
jgi:hypothetical protein